jgi:very-short-patch-repair endonuclease
MNGKQLADHFGIGITTVHRWLNDMGLKISRRKDIDLIALRERYDTGMSVKGLAKEFGVASSVIVSRLNELGIIPRNRSEAMYVRMSHTSLEERRRLTDAAHAAVRGVCQTDEHRCKIATTRQLNQTGISRTEFLFVEMLNKRGICSTQQKAFGRYNVDIALDEFPIVVEICGGGWHSFGAHAARYAERTKYILDRGLDVVVIWIAAMNYPLEGGAADYIVTLSEKLGSQKSSRGKEHMIRGNGESTSIGQRKFNDLPVIPCSECRNKITGRFDPRPFNEAIEM